MVSVKRLITTLAHETTFYFHFKSIFRKQLLCVVQYKACYVLFAGT